MGRMFDRVMNGDQLDRNQGYLIGFLCLGAQPRVMDVKVWEKHDGTDTKRRGNPPDTAHHRSGLQF